ncbi:unnamed protein product [Owenia fusiformis]|uniref:Uncharacterized protein n=1 Tax=Owenia fusiformis TaxID=6347 RepID=A0A8J1TYU1_OWEFU|nr:unnamed protein product [Owenia fusiformis]
MEAESTEKPPEKGSEGGVYNCGVCKESFETKEAKLFPCLHSFCRSCVVSEPDNSVKCPLCSQVFPVNELTDNLLVTKKVPTTEGGASPHSEDIGLCTACEDNAVPTSFCVECNEWLCDGCVSAHRRVKVTKDHNIQSKEEASSNKNQKSQSIHLICPAHRGEQYRFYCQDCTKLTCRDCQLEDHKGHRYLTIEEATGHHRNDLKKSVDRLIEKGKHVNEALELIKRRHDEIADREVEVTTSIKNFAVRAIHEINHRAKTILSNLQEISQVKKSQLTKKQVEVLDLKVKIDQAVKVAQFAIKESSDTALLSSRRVMITQIRKVHKTIVQVPNPQHRVAINFEVDDNFNNHIKSAGKIMVDGVVYPGPGYAINNQGPPNPDPVQVTNSTSTVTHPVSTSSVSQHDQTSKQVVRQRPTTSTASNPPGTTQQVQNLPNLTRQQFLQLKPDQQAFLLRKYKQEKEEQKLRQANSLVKPLAQAVSQTVGTVDTQKINLIQLQQRRILEQQVQKQQEQQQQLQLQAEIEQLRKSNMELQKKQAQQGNLVSSTVPHKESTGSQGFTPRNYSTPSPQPQAPKAESPDSAQSGIKPKTERLSVDEPQMGMRLPVSLNPSNYNPDDDASTLYNDLKRTEKQDKDDTKDPVGSQTQMEEDSSTDTIPFTEQPKVEENAEQNVPHSQNSDDPNEDYCAVCHNGGDLLCCEFCPKVFHLKCHVPELKEFPNPDISWRCPLCHSVDELRITDTSPKSELTEGTMKRKAPVGLSDKELKVCERILLELFSHDQSTPFHDPVDRSVPNYYKIITQPMDLTSIKTKLRRGHFDHYDSVETFIEDVQLIFKNCATYNAPDSEVGKIGKRVEQFFNDLIQKLLPNYAQRASTPAPSPGPSDTESTSPRPKKRKQNPDSIKHIHAKEKDI